GEDPQLAQSFRGGAGGCARSAFDRALNLARLSFIAEAELLDLLTAVFQQLQRERLGAERPIAVDRPVFLRNEGRDLCFTLADHPQRRALHTSGRETLAHFLPQQRREVEANEIVERATRLLGIDQLQRQAPWLRNGFAYRVLRDFVEHDPVEGASL